MVVADRRRRVILSTAGHFFGISTNEDFNTQDDSALEKFLDQATCRTLCAHPVNENADKSLLKLTNELPVGKNTLVFFKVKF